MADNNMIVMNDYDDEDDDYEEEALLLLLLHQWRRNGCGRRWIHEINMDRLEHGEFRVLIPQLRNDEDRFYTYFRMSIAEYDRLHELIGPHITKVTTNYRRPVCSSERLCITLRFLSTGDSFGTISFNYKVGRTTVGEIVQETCTALWNVLQPMYLPVPTKARWQEISDRFRQKWQFPNCLGAIDGKHCIIQAPPNSGSLYFNYKGTFSIVLMALVDADCSFTIVDIGKYGRNSDGGIFRDSALGRGMANNTLNVPADSEIPNASCHCW